MGLPHGTGVGSLTPEGYDQAFYKIVPAAENLAKRGVDAIMVIGTSLTFYRGPEFNEYLIREIHKRTALPVSTMSTAIVDGLREVDAERVAVATAYTKVVNDKLKDLLTYHGFDVRSLESFGITEFGGGAIRKTEDEIIEAIVASIVDPADAQAFLGLQGDPWDSQEDMFMGLAGASISMVVVAIAHKMRRTKS